MPEAAVLAKQVNETVTGRKIKKVVAAKSPHKFTWYYGDPRKYNSLLAGETVGNAVNHGGMVEIKAGNATLLFGDGVGMQYYAKSGKLPGKHQLWIEFEDGSSLVAKVQM